MDMYRSSLRNISPAHQNLPYKIGEFLLVSNCSNGCTCLYL